MKLLILIASLFILFASFAQSQEDTSLIYTYDVWTEEATEQHFKPDSIYRKYKPHQFGLDYAAQPALALTPQQLLNNNLYSSYFNNYRSVPFYANRIPILTAGYSIGTSLENIFDAEFAQSPRSDMNYSIGYKKILANNLMRNARVNTNDIAFKFRWNHDFIKTWVEGNYFKYKLENNGGLIGDTLTDTALYENNPVRKNDAENLIEGGMAIIHFGVDLIPDSNKILAPYIESSIFSKMRRYDETLDTANNIYDTIIFSDQTTYDRFQLNDVKLGGGVHFKYNKHNFHASYNIEYLEYKNYEDQRQYRNQFLDGEYRFTGEFIKFRTNLLFHTLGDYIGTINSVSSVSFTFSKKHTVFAGANFFKAPQELMYNYYLANTNYWENDFKDREKLTGKLGYRFEKLNISVQAETGIIGNYTFLDSTGRPYQIDGNSSYFQLNTKGSPRWKHIGVNWDISYQLASEEFRLPEFIGKFNIFWQGGVFRGKKLYLQVGLDFTYFTDVSRKGFDTEINDFYLVDTQGTFGNSPILGGFITAKIGKRFIGYFNIDNTLANLFGPTQFVAERVPLTPLNFKVGLEWRFLN